MLSRYKVGGTSGGSGRRDTHFLEWHSNENRNI